MQELVASTDGYVFDIEIALENQLGAQPLPFPGMDKSGSAICMFYLNGMCSKGTACPFRHVKGDRTVVCKHWLRGLCKKGDDCEFLHEYDMSKMPECYFFSKFGQCSNKECPFLHIDPEKKMKDCPWYDRGFCRHGPNCKNRHVRRLICQCYINGFCLSGPKCKFVHPKFDLPVTDLTQKQQKSNLTCHYCNEFGHKAANCPKMSNTQKEGHQMKSPDSHSFTNPNNYNIRTINQYDNWNQLKQRSLDEVTCFKCGEKGHYANKCPKGHLAFLSSSANQIQTQVTQ